MSYTLLAHYDYWPPREALGVARRFAERALELDGSHPYAHVVLAMAMATLEHDLPGAAEALEKARRRAPASAAVLYWKALVEAALGRHADAIRAMERAVELEPTSPVYRTRLAWQYFLARRYEESVEKAMHATRLFPDYPDAWDNLKWIHLASGHGAPAAEAWSRQAELVEGDGDAMEQTFQQLGIEGILRSSLDGQIARARHGYVSPFDIAIELAALGEHETALSWLARSVSERESDLILLAVDPRLDGLRDLAGFGDLIRDVGLAEVPGALR